MSDLYRDFDEDFDPREGFDDFQWDDDDGRMDYDRFEDEQVFHDREYDDHDGEYDDRYYEDEADQYDDFRDVDIDDSYSPE